MNGADCEDGIAEFLCTCTDGWTGERCGRTVVESCTASSCNCDVSTFYILNAC